jgi:leucine dehydrogenase
MEHEELVVRRGSRSGRHVIVAVHSTALGPALGGVRMWHYSSTGEGIRDALRLAGAMTLKAAAAGLDLGGGKGVICAPSGDAPVGPERRNLLLDFGDLVESLGGRYITAEDVGIDAADLVAIGERTTHATGLPPERGGSGDPSPLTALGVEAAMRACALARFGSSELAGLRVAVIGFGHVGERLARRLLEAGAKVIASDVDPSKRALALDLGTSWVPPDEAMLTECEVIAPCALGGAIDRANVGELRCEVVCGAANNQLAAEELAPKLAARGIVYAPDFIVNAGGLINVYREIRGYSGADARKLVLGIEATLGRVLEQSQTRGITPLAAARALADERLRAATAA